VECDYSGGEQSEEIFDPSRSVMVSSQRTEDSSGSAASSGIPGTASTLPRPAARPAPGSKSVARMTENVTYQTSRTIKKMRLPAGSVRKMSLAILVDQQVSWEREKDGYKRVLTPPSPETLKKIRDLVAGVTGFTAERGDQLVIETMPFESTLQLEAPALPAAPAAPAGPAGDPMAWLTKLKTDKKKMMIVGGAVVAVLLLLGGLGFFLMRRRKNKKPDAKAAAALAAGETKDTIAITAGSLDEMVEAKMKERDALQQKMDSDALTALKLAPVITKTSEILAKHLREQIASDSGLSAQILRTWIREEEVDA
jgi:flagellar M-ring protein FliF